MTASSFLTGRLANRILLGIGLLVAAVAVFVAAALTGLELSSADRILPGVRVLGIAVGGLTPEAAAATISPRSTAILDQSIELRSGGRQWTTTPRALGAKLDPVELTAAAYNVGHAGPFLARVREQLRALQTQTDVPITSTADGAAIDSLLGRITADVDRTPRSAELTLADDGTVTFVTSAAGEALDQSNARALINRALQDGQASVELPTRVLPPKYSES